jgi:CubicO group peptidase (beta-lactamase class C family)
MAAPVAAPAPAPSQPAASAPPSSPPPAAAAPLTPPPDFVVVPQLSKEQITAFRDYLARAWRESGVPGMSVALVQPNHVLLLEGFGNRTAGAASPVTPDTRFAFGPASQAVNSLLLARLDSQHAIDLDGPARRYWDDFKLSDALAGRVVTLRQLLAMTAGVPEQTDKLMQQAHAAPDVLFTALAQLPVIAQPGDTFQYCESSAAAAGYLAVYAVNHRRAPADGLPAGYDALAKARLFDPLGMKSATFGPTAGDDDARGHLRNDSGQWQPATTPATTALLPARGLRASARDAAAWLQTELSGGLAPDGSRLIEESLVLDRWDAVKARDAERYGLGWTRQYYQGRELLARAGEEGNQAALVAIIPQFRTALVVLINGGGPDSAVFLQDALLNFADMMREAAVVPKN